MRLHRCAEIGCHELIKLGFDYCDKHYQSRMNSYRDRLKKSQELKSQTLRGQHDKLEYNRNYNENVRPELGHEFYKTTQWERISRYVKQRDMYTDSVDGIVYESGDLIVDHIVPRRLLTTKTEQYDISNLWLLSRARHSHKTFIEQKMSDNKLRHLSRDWWKKVLKN
ncbi:HNH endonuclease signature motif containing protein [Leuconostoc mesenteroides]|uniref:HNH endonuclease signature motif containing protein n=1 Tax=Leuconostoc mesenteroides TaxID=1245 RepID=UPI0023622A48|nr:HNH endonuclease signature motif containing protein [Leuconostoc mesenteroides]MDM7539055.1 HNH endonuclease signature motif containing protein [Leuconostoc mesenteroides]